MMATHTAEPVRPSRLPWSAFPFQSRFASIDGRWIHYVDEGARRCCWQNRFPRIFGHATAAGLADARHFPFNDDPDGYSAAIAAWRARVATPQVPLADQHSHGVSRESGR